MISRKVIPKINFLFMSALSVTFIVPFIFMFINSVKTKEEYYTNPFNITAISTWNYKNYISIFSQFRILDLFKTTALIDIASCVLVITFAILCSYAIAKLEFRFIKICYMAIIATMFIPVQVTMIPMYVMFARMDLIDNYWSVILSYVAGFLPQNIFLMVSFFRGIPDEILEAAEIDGCGFFATVRHVVIPLGRTGIIINVIFNLFNGWNDLFLPMVLLTKYEMRTVMVALAQLAARQFADPTFQMAGLLVSTVPILLLYLVLQKYIVRGITMGAIK